MDALTAISELIHEGTEHHVAYRLTDAVDCYSRLVKMAPDSGEGWRLLGVIALQTGDTIAARSLLQRAIRIDANDAAAHTALGSVNEAEGKLHEACAAYTAASLIDAQLAGAWTGLMRATFALGRPADAIAIGATASCHCAYDSNLLRILGTARLQMRDYHGAATDLLASLNMLPNADAYSNLGAALVHLHRVDEAIVACEKSLILNPSHADATNNVGIARKAAGQYSQALAAFERAVELGCEEAHMNLGTTRLLLGDYRGGWPEFGWESAERRRNPANLVLPMWDGTPALAKRLLIWPEQGIGDTIQMARFIRQARDRVASIAVVCPPTMIDVLRTVDGIDELLETCERSALARFDLWLPTIRLPVVFATSTLEITGVPYVRADPARCERFRPLLDTPGKRRVGLVWSGNSAFAWNDMRSCGLAALEALQDVPGITWFALQQGDACAQQAQSSLPLHPINAYVSDFADTAAIIAGLDLVVTVDTSVAHLAGALGRPAWVLLSNRPDWRWGLSGSTSPWYPTLRLFRQSDDGQWAPVVEEIADALREFTAYAA